MSANTNINLLKYLLFLRQSFIFNDASTGSNQIVSQIKIHCSANLCLLAQLKRLFA